MSEYDRIREMREEAEAKLRNPARDTEDRCHCGMAYMGSDHCSECGCEQYETESVRVCPDLLVYARDLCACDGQLWLNLSDNMRIAYVKDSSEEIRAEA